MYLEFKSIKIVGFKSIENDTINLDNRGIVKVKGINLSEDKTNSNGSGKSSIFEAITWALYGKTSNGITNPSNKYTDLGCYVTLDLCIDGINYLIKRYIHNGSGLEIYLNNNGDLENISGRNKTDTDKIIQEIIGINQEIFLSIIFLSQGYNNRISNLGPSARKSRIEILADIVERVERFKDELNSKKSLLSSSERSISMNLSGLTGELTAIERNISNAENILMEHANDPEVDEIEIENLKLKINELDESIDKITDKINQITSLHLQALRTSSMMKNSEISRLRSEIDKKRAEFNSIQKSVCPTCGSKLNEDKKRQMENEINSLLNTNNNKISELQNELSAINNKIFSIQNTLNSLDSKLSELKKTRMIYHNKYENLISTKSFNRKIYQSQISDNKALKLDLLEKQKDLNKQKSDIDESIGIIDNCLRIVTKQFRDHLLLKIIEFINKKLEQYSNILFSNDNFTIKLSESFQIYVGDFEYSSLSGGEARKVDIALSLAQRDLALNVSGITSNIFILDEILDNLDETATSSALEMITSISTEISSLFIISHNNYEIAYDDEIVIQKQDNISRLLSS